jgi:hypothetical protein
MVLLQIDVQRFAVLRFKGDTLRAVHVDRIAPGRAARRMKIEPRVALHMAMLKKVRGHRARECHNTMRRSRAARRAEFLSRDTCSGRRDLRCACLANATACAERMIRLSSNGFSCRNACLHEYAPT